MRPEDVRELMHLRRQRDGVDCYLLVALALRRMGMDCPLVAAAALAAEQPLARELMPEEVIQAGDVFQWIPASDWASDLPAHVAVAIGPGHVMHMAEGDAPVLSPIEVYARARRRTGRVVVVRPLCFDGREMGGITITKAPGTTTGGEGDTPCLA